MIHEQWKVLCLFSSIVFEIFMFKHRLKFQCAKKRCKSGLMDHFQKNISWVFYIWSLWTIILLFKWETVKQKAHVYLRWNDWSVTANFRHLSPYADNLPSPKSKLSGGGGVVARNCSAPTFSAHVKLHVYAHRAHQLCFFHQRSHCENLKPSFERYHYMNSSR